MPAMRRLVIQLSRANYFLARRIRFAARCEFAIYRPFRYDKTNFIPKGWGISDAITLSTISKLNKKTEMIFWLQAAFRGFHK
jgi:hypothetical protein